MKYHVNSLDKSIMIGVGAVFLYQAGIINPGPQWIKNLGMRWLLRILQEPVRLIRSTVPSLLHFLYLAFKAHFLK